MRAYRARSTQRLHRRWIEYFFVYSLLISTGGFVFILTGWDPTQPFSEEPASYLGRINTLAISFITFWIYLRNYRIVNAAMRASWPLFLFLLLAFLSCFWSDEFAVTFRRAYALAFSFLAGACLVALLPPARMLRALCLALAWAMLLSVAFSLFLPAYGLHQANETIAPVWAGHWRGIYTHKNTLGNTASFALLMFAIFAKNVIRSRVFRIATLGAVGACLFGAASSTGLLVALIMIATSIGFSMLLNVRRGTRALVLGGTSFLIVLGAVTAIPILSVVLELLGKEPDLTGRVPIWNTIMPWAMERPWLGFGFSNFEQAILPRFFALTGERLVNAHNGYFETFISFGIVGLALLVFVLVSFVRNVVYLLRRQSPNERLVLPFAVAIFVGVLCSNVTESFFLAYSSIQGVIFAIAYISVAVSRSMATAPVPQAAGRAAALPLGVPVPIPLGATRIARTS